MPVIDGSFPKRVLLVGAGFSRNWGGLLANEVAGRIMAHPAVRARPRLGPLILHEPTFEDALEKSREGPFEAADAAAIETAIRTAFDDMDADYRDPNPPVLSATVNDFIGKFCPGPVGIGTGYVFSLNQDLLLERIYGTIVNRQKLAIPGISSWADRPPPFPAGAQPIPPASLADLSGDEPPLLKNFNHIKLHGSINWRSSDGSSSLVMGRRKPQIIARFPLIDWYHRVFEQVLFSGDVRLMVIGYGWGDEHINEPIANAVRNHGLHIYSWNPQHPNEILAGRHRADDILGGIMGFATRSMTEVMPNQPMNPGSAHYDGIVRDFF
jgi:SIR2-like domain